MKTEQDALKLARKIKKEDPRVATNVTGKGVKFAIKLELRRHALRYTVHSLEEWNSIRQAWSIFD